MKHDGQHFSRRSFCKLASGAVASGLTTACLPGAGSYTPNDGRITARPHTAETTLGSGQIKLDVGSERGALLWLPNSESHSPLPLLVFLHGAGQSAEQMFGYLGSAHQEAGVAVLAPNSRDHTWDAIGDSFGPDVELLNRALERVFENLAVDPTRLAIGGFSDGATYAISLGLINGDLFNRVIGFSAGFVVDGPPHGKPRFFISHGTEDHILPIDSCGRRIVAGLKARGYDVIFREFEGDHEVPEEVAREGLAWVAAKGAG